MMGDKTHNIAPPSGNALYAALDERAERIKALEASLLAKSERSEMLARELREAKDMIHLPPPESYTYGRSAADEMHRRIDTVLGEA